MVKISSKYREVSLNMSINKVVLFRFVKVRHKIPLITKYKRIRYEWSTVCAHRNPHYLLINHAFKFHIYVSIRKAKAKRDGVINPQNYNFDQF